MRKTGFFASMVAMRPANSEAMPEDEEEKDGAPPASAPADDAGEGGGEVPPPKKDAPPEEKGEDEEDEDATPPPEGSEDRKAWDAAYRQGLKDAGARLAQIWPGPMSEPHAAAIVLATNPAARALPSEVGKGLLALSAGAAAQPPAPSVPQQGPGSGQAAIDQQINAALSGVTGGPDSGGMQVSASPAGGVSRLAAARQRRHGTKG